MDQPRWTSLQVLAVLAVLAVGCGLSEEGTAPVDGSVTDVTLDVPSMADVKADTAEPTDAADAKAKDAADADDATLDAAVDSPHGDADAGEPAEAEADVQEAPADAADASDATTDASEASAEAGDAATDAADAPQLFTIGGSVTGLPATDSLQLDDNGGDVLFVDNDGAFMFSTPLANGAAYTVTLAGQPLNATCSVTGGTGAVADADVTSVMVTCMAAPTYTLSGTVAGYTGSTLQLSDGTSTITVPANAVAFSFSGLPNGTMYTVTVTTQPAGQSCTVTAGATGTIQGADVSGPQVTCATTPACSPTCGDGMPCGADTDCASQVCTAGRCAPPACSPMCPDGHACDGNGDCGSNSCGSNNLCKAPGCSPTCNPGSACGGDGDCASQVCTNAKCAPPACAPMCIDGNVCGVNGDCGSAVCANNLCKAPSCSPTCNDGSACGGNGDCGSQVCTASKCAAPACAPHCADGTPCGGNGDCMSNKCNNGMCHN